MSENKGALSEVPINLNLLSNINFKMLLKRSPEVNYFCTKITIPGITLPAVWQGTPFTDIPHAGDRPTYKPLVVTFLVDEDLTNWLAMYQWIRDLGISDDPQQYKALKSHPQYTGIGLKSDIVISILDSSRNANFNFTYYDAIPTELSDLQFDSESPDVMMIQAAVVLRFLNWSYETNT